MTMIRFVIEFDIGDTELKTRADNAQRQAAADAFDRAVRQRVFDQGFLPAGIQLIGKPTMRPEVRGAETE